jgi:hypothetical protein
MLYRLLHPLQLLLQSRVQLMTPQQSQQQQQQHKKCLAHLSMRAAQWPWQLTAPAAVQQQAGHLACLPCLRQLHQQPPPPRQRQRRSLPDAGVWAAPLLLSNQTTAYPVMASV